MVVAVPKETFPHERRVALVPALVPALVEAGLRVTVETGAGADAGYPDAEFEQKGAAVAADHGETLTAADIVIQVRGWAAREGQVVIGFLDPLGEPEACRDLAAKGVAAFSMELIPRITRAQSMDALSSMATIAGYKAVLLAAEKLPKMFPMMMTAAGTISPARVFVVGAGVAGLQAIATARRLGAVVQAYDVRPAVKEQVESLGAKFVELPVAAEDSEDRGGYAKEMDEDFYRRQRETMTKVVAESDVVVTTALIPGKTPPVLVTADMVAGMAPGSVIVDLAAERGGNCELTKPDEETVENGVTVIGPTNLPSTVPYHASQMYAKNVTALLLHLVKDGEMQFDLDDEITRETLVCRNGEVVHPRVRELLGQPGGSEAERTDD